jgi:hypothetical protein
MAVPTKTVKLMESTQAISVEVTTLRSTSPPKYRAHDTSGGTVE